MAEYVAFLHSRISFTFRLLSRDGSAKELPSSLANAYKARYPAILDKSRNWQDADYTKYTNSLDRQEQTCMACSITFLEISFHC
jgi:hypothetical protein